MNPVVDLLLAAVRYRYGAADQDDVREAARAAATQGPDQILGAARRHALTPCGSVG